MLTSIEFVPFDYFRSLNFFWFWSTKEFKRREKWLSCFLVTNSCLQARWCMSKISWKRKRSRTKRINHYRDLIHFNIRKLESIVIFFFLLLDQFFFFFFLLCKGKKIRFSINFFWSTKSTGNEECDCWNHWQFKWTSLSPKSFLFFFIFFIFIEIDILLHLLETKKWASHKYRSQSSTNIISWYQSTFVPFSFFNFFFLLLLFSLFCRCLSFSCFGKHNMFFFFFFCTPDFYL